jgi:membrane protein DedA with SNARE-associated domain/rhodanese-related sulfurtransferase
MALLIGWLEHAGAAAVFVFVLIDQGVAVLACIVADLAWYRAGRRLGSRDLRAMCKLSLESDSCVSDTERLFMRFGTRVLVFAKFVPGLGAVATAMSGVVGASLVGFVAYDLIGGTTWANLAISLGAIFHDAVESVFKELAQLGRIEELFRLRAERTALLLIDARSSASRARDGVIPGAIAFERLTEDHERAGEGEVVVYCSCPNEATSARLAKRLMAMRFHPVRQLTSGIHAWQDADFAVERS